MLAVSVVILCQCMSIQVEALVTVIPGLLLVASLNFSFSLVYIILIVLLDFINHHLRLI